MTLWWFINSLNEDNFNGSIAHKTKADVKLTKVFNIDLFTLAIFKTINTQQLLTTKCIINLKNQPAET